MRLYRPFPGAQFLYPEAVFRIRKDEKILCLTFDDGPDPSSTPLILSILREHGVKAVFFCIGSKAERHPDLMNLIQDLGHLSGNHGYEHKDGWKSSSRDYLDNIFKAAPFTSGRLFRPPFGRLTFHQYKQLAKSFRIYLWDLMPYDFDASFGEKNSLRVLERKIRPGSVIVLHDTADSSAAAILPEFINYAKGKGYSFVY